MTKYINIAEKLGFAFAALVILNILNTVIFGRLFMSIFTTFWMFSIGLALVVYPMVLKRHVDDKPEE